MKNNFYNRFVELKRYTDRVGSVYGTEDFSVYLYSMIKMMKPKKVVELGTGLGSTMLWSALALEENGEGTIYTVDDGSEWERLRQVKDLIGNDFQEDYNQFIASLIKKHQFDNISFFYEKIDVLDVKNIDILFSDFAHGVFDITKLLVNYLPKMNSHSRIYIDSASTHYSSYMALEKLVELLNDNKIPRVFHDVIEYSNKLERDHHIDVLQDIIQNSEFKIDHIIENKDRNQNSTCCITMSPIDIFPYPRKNIRFA